MAHWIWLTGRFLSVMGRLCELSCRGCAEEGYGPRVADLLETGLDYSINYTISYTISYTNNNTTLHWTDWNYRIPIHHLEPSESYQFTLSPQIIKFNTRRHSFSSYYLSPAFSGCTAGKINYHFFFNNLTILIRRWSFKCGKASSTATRAAYGAI
jgi:hypothetical protein